MSDIKYMLAYIIPISGYVAVWQGGIYAPLTLFIAFVIIPLLEFFVAKSTLNLTSDQEFDVTDVPYFDWLLYLNLPLVYGLVIALLYRVTQTSLYTSELGCHVTQR